MGRKIFVSYKYGDTSVAPLKELWSEVVNPTTVRNYVDDLQDLLADDHINKGEADGEDLSDFMDSTIASKLRDKIFDSSITIVVISPNMKESYTAESKQWIPWEIAYSLKEHSRNGRTSQTNAVLALVLPDRNNSYDYFVESRTCCDSGCRYFYTKGTFQIIQDNLFNAKSPDSWNCDNGSKMYRGDSSYIHSVKWSDFKANVNSHLDKAVALNDKISEFNITKTVK